MCRGSSSPRVKLVAVKPVNSDRQKHMCAVMFSQVLLKSSSHSSWHRQVGFPLFSQMGSSTCCCHSTSGTVSVHMSSSSSVVVAGTQYPGSSTLDQRMELARFSSRGRCVGSSSARSTVRSFVWLLNCLSGFCFLRRMPLHVRFLMVHWADRLERSHILHIYSHFT